MPSVFNYQPTETVVELVALEGGHHGGIKVEAPEDCQRLLRWISPEYGYQEYERVHPLSTRFKFTGTSFSTKEVVDAIPPVSNLPTGTQPLVIHDDASPPRSRKVRFIRANAADFQVRA